MVSGFIHKLYSMLQDTSIQHLMRWSPDGLYFTVIEPDDLAKEVIPNYFKHSNFTSFVRQLNMYGFQKTHDAAGSSCASYSLASAAASAAEMSMTSLESETPAMDRSTANLDGIANDEAAGTSSKTPATVGGGLTTARATAILAMVKATWDFSHPCFQRDRPELMRYITRNASGSRSKQQQSKRKASLATTDGSEPEETKRPCGVHPTPSAGLSNPYPHLQVYDQSSMFHLLPTTDGFTSLTRLSSLQSLVHPTNTSTGSFTANVLGSDEAYSHFDETSCPITTHSTHSILNTATTTATATYTFPPTTTDNVYPKNNPAGITAHTRHGQNKDTVLLPGANIRDCMEPTLPTHPSHFAEKLVHLEHFLHRLQEGVQARFEAQEARLEAVVAENGRLRQALEDVFVFPDDFKATRAMVKGEGDPSRLDKGKTVPVVQPVAMHVSTPSPIAGRHSRTMRSQSNMPVVSKGSISIRTPAVQSNLGNKLPIDADYQHPHQHLILDAKRTKKAVVLSGHGPAGTPCTGSKMNQDVIIPSVSPPSLHALSPRQPPLANRSRPASLPQAAAMETASRLGVPMAASLTNLLMDPIDMHTRSLANRGATSFSPTPIHASKKIAGTPSGMVRADASTRFEDPVRMHQPSPKGKDRRAPLPSHESHLVVDASASRPSPFSVTSGFQPQARTHVAEPSTTKDE